MAPQTFNPHRPTFDSRKSTLSVINLDSDDDKSDGDQTLTGDEFRDRFITPTPPSSQRPVQTKQDPEDDPHFKEQASLQYGGSTLKAGKTVELGDGDFIRMTMILQHRDTQVYSLRGLRFRRIRPLDDVLDYTLNEVVLLLRNDTADPRTITRQSTETVALHQIVRVRAMVKTNQLFPALSCGQSDASMGRDWTKNHSRLVCRWQFWYFSKNEGFLQALAEDACDSDYGVDSQGLRHTFRGNTTRGGSSANWLAGEEAFDKEEREGDNMIDLTIEAGPKQRYTFGDCYCCAGGASRGAKAARLHNIFGFDNNQAALTSFALNFFGAQCYCVDVYDLIKTLMDDFKVDVLHMSPPCKTYSPAHTRPGKNDETNEATFLATEELIKKTKPRIVTLEETFGLTRTLENQSWFKALLRMFSRLGFSSRWKVFDLCDYGLPQPRKRPIMVASWYVTICCTASGSRLIMKQQVLESRFLAFLSLRIVKQPTNTSFPSESHLPL